MKDGYKDKLQDLVLEVEKEGELCTVIGVRYEALDSMHCDICRLVMLQNLAAESALRMLNHYIKRRDGLNARSH